MATKGKPLGTKRNKISERDRAINYLIEVATELVGNSNRPNLLQDSIGELEGALEDIAEIEAEENRQAEAGIE